MAVCSWSTPGANPYKGSLVQALDRYGFTPSEQAVIVARHKRVEFDTFVTIRKDDIYAPFGGVASDLRDMHFGRSGFCAGEVDRSGWADHHEEVALVYCAAERCVAIPRVCGNVSQIKWSPSHRPEVEIRPEYDQFVHRNDVHTVPEPASAALVVVAVVAMALIRRFK